MIVLDEYEDDDSNGIISLRSPSQVESEETNMAPIQLGGVIALQNQQSNRRPLSKLFAKDEDTLSQGNRMIQGIGMSQGHSLNEVLMHCIQGDVPTPMRSKEPLQKIRLQRVWRVYP